MLLVSVRGPSSGLVISAVLLMEIIQCLPKGTMMDTTEYYHIYKATKLGIQINDKNTTQSNMLFDTLIQHEATRRHPMERI